MIKNKNDYLVIKPPSGLLNIDWNELWKYRELLYIFAWRDIKVRYKQTVIGIAWALFQPFVTMVIFSFFFGKLAKVPSEGVPYPI
ncbi:MAG TPA: ABC transporter permease, partial [bacterium]|nr:ABC transporter permease [bacterium]